MNRLMNKALFTNKLAMLLYGVSAVLIGPTLPGIIAQFDLSLSAAGLIGTLQNAGGVCGAVVVLVLAERVSRPAAILVCFALLAAALIAIGVSDRYLTLIIAFAASGVFIRIVDVMLNAHTGDLTPGDSGKALSALHMFYGIGAFAGPMVVRGLMRAGVTWAGVFVAVGALYLAALLATSTFFRGYLASGRRSESRSASVGSESRRQGAAADKPIVLIGVLGLLLFFYAMHQIGVVAWLPYYLETGRAASADLASFSLSAYWVGIIAGRFLTSRIVARVGAEPILCGGAFVGAAAASAGVLVPLPSLAVILFAIAGMASGATIPLAYSVGYRVLPDRTGSVTAWMSLVMLGGKVLSPWLVGAVADRASLVFAMMLPALVLFVSGALALVILQKMAQLAVAGSPATTW